VLPFKQELRGAVEKKYQQYLKKFSNLIDRSIHGQTFVIKLPAYTIQRSMRNYLM